MSVCNGRAPWSNGGLHACTWCLGMVRLPSAVEQKRFWKYTWHSCSLFEYLETWAAARQQVWLLIACSAGSVNWTPRHKHSQNCNYCHCRAMLCRSAAIAVMRCLPVRPSVCLSVTFVDHIKTNKHIFEFFSPSSSQIILVFPYQTGWRYSDGIPLPGGSRMQVGYRQKSRFWFNSWLSKIAGRAKCQKHLPTTKLSIWHSQPRTTGYRPIAGRANYEVTKTVTDDHAV